MSQATEMEHNTEKNPVTPGVVLPAAELYGDMLVESKRWPEARTQYETALKRSPNRFNSLLGAGRAAELAGNNKAAASFYRQLLDNCPAPTGERAGLEHARGFLARADAP